MNRLDFINKVSAAAIISFPLISLWSCTDSDEGGMGPGNTEDCLKNGTRSTILANHGHSLQVSKSDVERGSAKEYAIMGSANHDHMLTVSSDDFNKLKNNNQINVSTSSSNGHNHSITVSCA